MHRAQPIISKIVNKKWVDSQHEAHKERLDQIKPTLAIKPTTKYSYLEVRPKQKQIKEDRY